MTKIERWKPEKGERYWYISNVLMVAEDCWDGVSHLDEERYNAGNCFKTEAAATTAAEKVKALLLSLPDNGNNLVSNLPDKELPKLTAEVFDRPDCPEWAKYAAVDAAGLAYWYQYFPVTDERIGVWKVWENKRQLIDGFFDRSDWQNSLIERSAQLPDWVEVGGYVYDPRNGYGKIVSGSVKSCYIEFDGGAGDFVPEAFAELKQARLRPYNAEELRGLVGKVLQYGRHTSLVTMYNGNVDDVFVGDGDWFSASVLLKECTLDGNPAGVLEHLEDGEWKE